MGQKTFRTEPFHPYVLVQKWWIPMATPKWQAKNSDSDRPQIWGYFQTPWVCLGYSIAILWVH